MSQITLKDEEKKCLKPFIDHLETARTAFAEASRMIRDCDAALWKKIRKLWPDAVQIDHPADGKWTITVCKKPSTKD